MDVSSLKRKPLNDDELRRHVGGFTETAGDALDSSDSAETWNQAFEYAKQHELSSRDMTRVLSVLRAEHRVSGKVLAEWMKEAPEALGEVCPPADPDALTNRGVEAHSVSTPWTYAEVARELYTWADRFNQHFFGGKLPPPALSIARARPTVLGSYQLTRDGLGLKYRININAIHLGRGRVDVLHTLLHELIHQWEEVEHRRKQGGAYHTKVFREKAGALGIPTDHHGHSLGIAPDGAFIRLLRMLGVSSDEFKLADLGVRAAEARPPTLQKWSCGCTNIWSSRGTNVQGVCELCARRWVRSR